MPPIHYCVSPEQMPHLEPLGGPSNEVSSVRDPLTSPPPLPPESGTLLGLATTSPSNKTRRPETGQFMRNVTEPLKLSLVLENKGNVARDHLASERTYLAYVRTSLACASAGVALVQLFTLRTASNLSAHQSVIDLTKFANPLGAAIMLFALGILAIGLVRYFATQSALIRGYFPVARNSITAIAFVLGALVCTVFAIIAAGTRIWN